MGVFYAKSRFNADLIWRWQSLLQYGIFHFLLYLPP